MPSTAKSETAPITIEDRIRVTLPMLVRLNQAAAGLKLCHAGIRANQGGNYLSSFKGRGMEFDETRPYTPGDDIRTLDWRVIARTGKTHTKLYREERERPVFLSVDARQPMFFATQGVFKSVLAAQLAALVAWSAQRHGDRIGGQIFAESGSQEFKPQPGRPAVLHFLQQLTHLTPTNQTTTQPTSIDTALSRLSRHALPGSLIFIFSDFRGLSPDGEFNLIRLRRHCDLALVFISDEMERHLPDSGHYRFGDGAREWSLHASPTAARMHASRYADRSEQIRTLARTHRMRFLPCTTADDPLSILQARSRQPSATAA